ncbi:transporter [Rhizobiales bacterium]|uniref:OmpP1/FadL family transporter n=1 Tax=Hongsoonwoonella zoysiae TaxID=2821844 RepID=UPI0015619678|nr:OmpP1/FadL family transporter [Hongsoonwoonella zoysiae]NRG17972.1 transporter [Hongsoonwoonella zoysiae]
MTTKTWAKLSVAAIALAAVNGEAFAGAFAIREQSSYYQGTSFAGYGTTGPSISSIFWNPATITGAGDGITFESHNTAIIPDSEIDGTFAGVLTGSSGDIGNDAYVPATYTSYKVNEDIFLGLAVNAPFGLATKPNQNWNGQFYSRSSEIFSINVNPIAGYRISEKISVAVGLQVQYLDVTLKRANPLTPAPYASITLDGDDIGFGATAGISYKPFEGTEFGLGYRSGIAHDLDGDLNVLANTAIEADLVTPDQVNFSFKQRINDSFRVLGTVEWTNWSRLGSPAIVSPSLGPVADLPLNYDDGWFFALGGEYDYNENLTLRAGLGYEISPIDDDIRSTRLPDADRLWLSGGLTYAVNDNLAFDFGYTHIFVEDADINIGPGHQDYNALIGTYVGESEAHVDIISASLRYRWGGPSEDRDHDTARKY